MHPSANDLASSLNIKIKVIKINPSLMIDIIRASLTVSSILLGAETFLVGLYLMEWQKGVDKSRLMLLIYLLASLLIPSAILVPLNTLVIISTPDFSELIKAFLTFIALLPLIPDFVITYILIKKRP